jgi:hypothetical protein
VRDVQPDGGLVVESSRTGQQLSMPAGYVGSDAALAYASTVHAAEGSTVDTGHVLLTLGMATNSVYVGLTRGRVSNTAWVFTETGILDTPARTPRGVLAGIIEYGPDLAEWSATDVTENDERHRVSAGTLLGLIEDHTHIACRTRLDGDLDSLVADGVLAEADRARFGSDQGSEHLARQLRALEQAGRDPAAILRDAVMQHSLDDAVSVAQVVSSRIDRRHGLPVPDQKPAEPQRIPAADTSYLTELRGLLDQRCIDLGERLADQSGAGDAPTWVIETLGPAPAEDDRANWTARAGSIAAHREATGWGSPDVAIGRCPGVRTPEKRADWHTAYTAAGMPDDRRPEAEMIDGRLLVRAAAADRAWANAPAFVDDAMRARHQAADHSGYEAVHAWTRDDTVRASGLEREAAEHAATANRLTEIAEQRGAYLAHYAETFSAGEAAREELARRGIQPGQEADRTTAVEWLAADHAARAIDEQHREITENDIYNPIRDESETSRHIDEDATGNARRSSAHPPSRESATAAHDRSVDVDRDSGAASPERDAAQTSDRPGEHADDVGRTSKPVSAAASVAEVAAAAEHAAAISDHLANQASQDAHMPDDDEWHRQRDNDTADTEQSSHLEPTRDTGHASSHTAGDEADGLS